MNITYKMYEKCLWRIFHGRLYYMYTVIVDGENKSYNHIIVIITITILARRLSR